MHRGMFLAKLPGQVVPQDMVERACKAFPSCVGSALVADGVLGAGQEMITPTWSNINGIQEKFKDKLIVFFFGEFPDGALEDDIQPFMIGTDAGDDIAAVFMDGEFVNFDKKGSSHSSDFQCWETALSAYMLKWWKASEKDLAKFEAELKDPVNDITVKQLWANRGNITVLLANGHLISWADEAGQLRRTYPWGFTTQHLGYTHVTYATPAAAAAAAPATASKRFNPFAEKPTVVVPAVAPAEVPEVKTDTAIPDNKVDEADENVHAACPASITKNGPMKDWYRNWSPTGHAGDNFRARPIIRTKIKKGDNVTLKKAGLEHLIVGLNNLKEAVKPVTAPAPAATPADKPGVEALPILPPNEVKRLHDFINLPNVKSYLEGKTSTLDEKIQALEKDLPTFAKLTGIPAEQTFRWDYAMFLQIAERVGPSALAMLCNEKNQALVNLSRAAQDPIGPKKEEVVETPPPAAVAVGGRRRIFG